MITFKERPEFNKQAALILLDQEQLKKGEFPFHHPPLRKEIERLRTIGQFHAEKDQFFPLILNKTLILLAGLGKKEDFSLAALRITVRKTLLSSYLKKIKEVEILPSDAKDSTIQAVIEGILLGTYAWEKYKTKPKDDQDMNERNFFLIAAKKKLFEDTIQICKGTNFTRDLINDNADTVTSEYLEKTIRSLIKGRKNISLAVLNEKEMKAKGLNLHLAVNQGSRYEPKLIIVKYSGGSENNGCTALVGKGITFDTGGLNLKPSGSMETMRTDMSGAAAVAGILKNTLALNLKKNVIFALTLAENAIGSGAYKPGDVIRSYSGKTVEIGNTDAEGRLVLADTISYLIKNYKPARIIDVATLTGACVVALGNDYSGLVTKDDQFSRQLVRASNETDDRIWRLPIYPELKDSVKSKIADIRNLGFSKGAAGAITAAEFLHQFTEGTLWAHLDIAGTAFVEGAGRMYFGHGATGAGVRLLTNYLMSN